MGRKKKEKRQRYQLSDFSRQLLMYVRLYAVAKGLYVWQAMEELVGKGLRYDAEHELRTLQDKTLAKSTNFFAQVLGLGGKKKESGRKQDEHP